MTVDGEEFLTFKPKYDFLYITLRLHLRWVYTERDRGLRRWSK